MTPLASLIAMRALLLVGLLLVPTQLAQAAESGKLTMTLVDEPGGLAAITHSRPLVSHVVRLTWTGSDPVRVIVTGFAENLEVGIGGIIPRYVYDVGADGAEVYVIVAATRPVLEGNYAVQIRAQAVESASPDVTLIFTQRTDQVDNPVDQHYQNTSASDSFHLDASASVTVNATPGSDAEFTLTFDNWDRVSHEFELLNKSEIVRRETASRQAVLRDSFSSDNSLDARFEPTSARVAPGESISFRVIAHVPSNATFEETRGVTWGRAVDGKAIREWGPEYGAWPLLVPSGTSREFSGSPWVLNVRIVEAVAPIVEVMPAQIWSFILAAAAGMVGIAAILWRSERVRVFVSFLIAPFYARAEASEALAHARRSHVYVHIRENPGITFSELRRATALPNGVLVHHLQVLTRAGFIESRTDGARRRYQASGLSWTEQSGISDAERRVVDLVQHAGLSPIDAANRLGITRQAVSWHLRNARRREESR